jgi:hypothetical protein
VTVLSAFPTPPPSPYKGSSKFEKKAREEVLEQEWNEPELSAYPMPPSLYQGPSAAKSNASAEKDRETDNKAREKELLEQERKEKEEKEEAEKNAIVSSYLRSSSSSGETD